MKYNKNESLGRNAIRGVDITEPEDVFTPDNTEWVTEEYGDQHLVYTGDMDELSIETGKTVDELYDLLAEYEDASKDFIETQREIDEARKGQY